MKKTNDNYDVIYAENEKGEIDLFNTISIDRGILSNKITGTITPHGKEYSYDAYG